MGGRTGRGAHLVSMTTLGRLEPTDLRHSNGLNRRYSAIGPWVPERVLLRVSRPCLMNANGSVG